METAAAGALFEQFVAASTFKNIQQLFQQICTLLEIDLLNFGQVYESLRSRLTAWKAQKLWTLLDKRAAQKEYCKQKACQRCNVLIIGAGPCGLRAAIECALLGAKCLVVERRDRFSRNNVLHIWPFVIQDLKNLGAKIFYPKFCAGAIDHISIRQLQCILLKVALILGVQIHDSVGFVELLTPEQDNEDYVPGWRAKFEPAGHLLEDYEFDVLIGADGKRNTVPGFPRKEMRGKLAIGITANFVNRRSQAEEKVPEISGVAFIFNQHFFKTMTAETGIDLENIVYYKDETHYFVMCAKKQSLLDKGVIQKDYDDISQLLSADNVDQDRLRAYAQEAADFATEGRLPHLDYAPNHFNQSDVAMFDFTSLFSAACSVKLLERNGRHLLISIVGDSLHEPFWPTGSGCARGFLSTFDTAWMLRSYGLDRLGPMEMIAERESAYRLLAQATPDNLQKQIQKYTIDPRTRYQSLEMCIRPEQVTALVDTDCPRMVPIGQPIPLRLSDPTGRQQLTSPFWRRYRVWRFCQLALTPAKLRITNFDKSWSDGRALLALLIRYQLITSDIIPSSTMTREERRQMIQMCFDAVQSFADLDPPCSPDSWPPSESRLVEYLYRIMETCLTDRKRVHNAMQTVLRTPGSTQKRKAPVDASRGKKSEPIRRRTETLLVSLSSTSTINSGLPVASEEAGDDDEVAQILTDWNQDQRHAKRLRELCGFNNGEGGQLENGEKKWTKRPLVDKLNPERVYQVQQIVTGELEQQKTRDIYREKHRRADMLTRKMDPKDLQQLEQKMENTAMGMVVNGEQYRVMTTMEEKIIRLNAADARKHAKDGFINYADIDKHKDIDEKLQKAEQALKLQQLAGIDIVTKTKQQQKNGHHHQSNGNVNGSPARTSRPQPPLPNIRPSKTNGHSTNDDEQENVVAFRKTADSSIAPMPSGADRRPLSMSVIDESVFDSVNPRRQQLCKLCQRVVYLAERMQVEGMFIHKKCFRCAFCGQALRLGNCAQDRNLEKYNPRFFCMQHLNLPLAEKINRIEKEDSRGRSSSDENTSGTNSNGPIAPVRKTRASPIVRPTGRNSPDAIAARTMQKIQMKTTEATPMTVSSTRTPERAEFECYSQDMRKLEKALHQLSLDDQENALNQSLPGQNSSNDSDRSDGQDDERPPNNDSSNSSDDEAELSDGEIQELETTVLNNMNKCDDRLTNEQATVLLNNWKRRRSSCFTPRNELNGTIYYTPANRGLNSSNETSSSTSTTEPYETPKAPLMTRETRSWSETNETPDDAKTIRERKLKEMARYREESRWRTRQNEEASPEQLIDRRSVPTEVQLFPLAEIRPVIMQREPSFGALRATGTEAKTNISPTAEEGNRRVQQQRHALPFPSLLGDGLPATPVMAPPPWASPSSPSMANGTGEKFNRNSVITIEQSSSGTSISIAPVSPTSADGQTLLAKLFEPVRKPSQSSDDRSAREPLHIKTPNGYEKAPPSESSSSAINCESQKETSILGKFSVLRKFKASRKTPEKTMALEDQSDRLSEEQLGEFKITKPTPKVVPTPRSRSTPNKHTLASSSFNGDLRRPTDLFKTPKLENGIAVKSPPITEKDIRRIQRVAERLIRQREQNRQRTAQDVVRRLQETDVRRAEVIEVGRDLEKRLVGDPCNRWVLEQWLMFVAEMQQLARLDVDLRNRMREMELEERHRRLQDQLKRIMAKQEDDQQKMTNGGSKLPSEKAILQQLLAVVQERDQLMNEIERAAREDRKQEDSQQLQKILADKGHSYRYFDPVFLKADDV